MMNEKGPHVVENEKGGMESESTAAKAMVDYAHLGQDYGGQGEAERAFGYWVYFAVKSLRGNWRNSRKGFCALA
jgi:hypothetical protein